MKPCAPMLPITETENCCGAPDITGGNFAVHKRSACCACVGRTRDLDGNVPSQSAHGSSSPWERVDRWSVSLRLPRRFQMSPSTNPLIFASARFSRRSCRRTRLRFRGSMMSHQTSAATPISTSVRRTTSKTWPVGITSLFGLSSTLGILSSKPSRVARQRPDASF